MRRREVARAAPDADSFGSKSKIIFGKPTFRMPVCRVSEGAVASISAIKKSTNILKIKAISRSRFVKSHFKGLGSARTYQLWKQVDVCCLVRGTNDEYEATRSSQYSQGSFLIPEGPWDAQIIIREPTPDPPTQNL